jgi:protein phosphatase 2C
VDSYGEQGGEEGVDDAEPEEELPLPPPTGPVLQLPEAAQASWPVAFGSLSVAGRSRDMEDTVSLRPGFHAWVDGSPMHFFGVFDGHGGSHVRTLASLVFTYH